MCGISLTINNKTYHGHLSESRIHDQVYTKESISRIISSAPDLDFYFIRSDNATNFKCAQCFYDLQMLSNEKLATIVTTYGIVGHGKGEIDSVGGHIKNAVRKSIAAGAYILNTDDCLAVLTNKFQDYESPNYIFEKIYSELLINQRNEANMYNFVTVDGSTAFHVLVFSPFQSYFLASNVLCCCDNCLTKNFKDCPNFEPYYPEVTKISKPLTRSEKVTIDEESTPVMMGGMVTAGSLFAIKAESRTDDFF